MKDVNAHDCPTHNRVESATDAGASAEAHPAHTETATTARSDATGYNTKRCDHADERGAAESEQSVSRTRQVTNPNSQSC